MAENSRKFLEPGIGAVIRATRLRAGITQVQLARSISRSGKFLSEVETGKARITRRDLDRLADALGVASEALLAGEPNSDGANAWSPPQRIRDLQPTGLTILTFSRLIEHLDRRGWLRGANLWMVGVEPFAEEQDVALVEQVASVLTAKKISLRYVFPTERLSRSAYEQLSTIQGTMEVLPGALLRALRWSATMRAHLQEYPESLAGYALAGPLPTLAHSHTLLWIETGDVSWSDVMPLLYCRGVTRTFEKPNESMTFWYHLPRDEGSRLLLELARQLGARSWQGQPQNTG